LQPVQPRARRYVWVQGNGAAIDLLPVQHSIRKYLPMAKVTEMGAVDHS